jgi:PAS domain S-box-containing protein
MQSVSDKFYTWYNRIATIIGVVLLLLAIGAWTMPSLGFLRIDWGLTPVVAVIAVIQIIYGLFIFRQEDKLNPWFAGFLASLIMSINVLGLLQHTGGLHSPYLALWGILVLSSAMFGLYSAAGSAFMMTLYFVLFYTGLKGESAVDPIAIGSVAGTYLLSGISYWVWQHFYTSGESIRVSQLSGQLKSKQQQSEILIQSISDGIIVVDIEGKINLMNPAAAKMTEWSVDEAIDIDVKLVVKFFQEDGKDIPAEQYPFTQVLKTNKQVDTIVQLVSRDGRNHAIVSLVISPVLLPKSNELVGSVAVFRDIGTAREEEHRRADFISTASHEMRTPVAAIEGYLALALNEKVSKIDNNARNYLVKAHESTQSLGKLFQDLLTSAKAEDGRLVNHPIVVEMGAYLQELTDGLRFAAENKNLLLDFAVGTADQLNGSMGGKMVKPLYYAHIDPDRMREVITNLFDNAVKYTETGKISIGLTANKDVIQFFIKDTGHGIPAEDIPHLFQKFYRVDNTTTRTIGGTGLGLFICRKIVELYTGRIWVESEVNKGSTFYINLPRLSTQKATELQAVENQQVI